MAGSCAIPMKRSSWGDAATFRDCIPARIRLPITSFAHGKHGALILDYIDKARDVIELEIQGLQQVRDGLDDSFDTAVTVILDALGRDRKIVVTGIGKNLHVGEKISATLASTGARSVLLNPSQAMHGDLGILNDGDIVLALSYSGESEELLQIIPSIKRRDIRIIAMTGKPDSALARCSDVVIPIAVEREACPFNMAPTTSTTATLAVGDALAMVLLDARGFKKEDYAKLHPGGAIGRALLLRVADIMRTDERVAQVSIGAQVKDAVVAMTRAKCGSAGVVDTEGRVLGIFTDGDLRRHLSETPSILDQPIEAVMTAAPITVSGDQLAVDVLRVFETNSIDDLLVVDADNRLIGAIDIQDLPKIKII